MCGEIRFCRVGEDIRASSFLYPVTFVFVSKKAEFKSTFRPETGEKREGRGRGKMKENNRIKLRKP